MTNRHQRAQQGAETLAIIEAGQYSRRSGFVVDIADNLRHSVERTRVIAPDDWGGIVRSAAALPERPGPAAVEVTGETTLAACRRLVQSERRQRVMALNFASAKNPGGGFLGGSQAQEESLARSSGLYASLQAGSRYYAANRNQKSLLYTDHAIVSPNVPVFRDDDGSLLDEPYCVSFVTMPAANVGAIPHGHADRDRVEETMARRVECVCALSAGEGYGHLILGAWGCGVFRNDPRMIARLFRERLFGASRWAWRLDHVVFAVLDRPPHNILGAFQEAIQS